MFVVYDQAPTKDRLDRRQQFIERWQNSQNREAKVYGRGIEFVKHSNQSSTLIEKALIESATKRKCQCAPERGGQDAIGIARTAN